jgi:hypothetical protein
MRARRDAPVASAPAVTAVALLTMGLLVLSALPAAASGYLTGFDISDGEPGPFPGTLLAKTVPIRWDDRCLPVSYSMNTTLDPIPNPLGEDFLSLAEARVALQAAFDRWNHIPTSYIHMEIDGTTDNPEPRGFDMINELTFRTPPGFLAFASSPSVSLLSDMLLADGTDMDADGDGDVTAGIETCRDIDGDGDIEFPEGFYEAGTILDNDVQFDTVRVRYTTRDEDADDEVFSVDLLSLGVHEFGHSHGLSHSIVTQISPREGNCPAMSATALDTGDPESELAQREVRQDDAGFSSLHYPEGNGASSLAALGPGDVAFDEAFGIIEGEVTHGVFGVPVPGGSVTAIRHQTEEVVAQVYTGRVAVGYNVSNGGLFAITDPSAILDGAYRLPVPRGQYELELEAIDGQPNAAGSITTPTFIGGLLGLLDFPEERWNGPSEAVLEARPGLGQVVPVAPGQLRTGIDFVTNRVTEITRYGELFGFVFVFAPPETYFAVRFDPQEVLEAAPDDFLIPSAHFMTFHFDRSQVPIFLRALLTTGSENPDGTVSVDLDHPLAESPDFVGQDLDRTPFYFGNAGLTRRVVKTAADEGRDLFLVLQVPEAPSGFHGFMPVFGVDMPQPGDGSPPPSTSYFSLDGLSWTFDPRWNYHFSLAVTETP